MRIVRSFSLSSAIWLALSALAAVCATAKGYNGVVLFFMALFASPLIALPVIVLAPARKRPGALPNPIDHLDNVTGCTRCGARVLRSAGCCLQCGEVVPTARIIQFPQITAAPRF